MQLYHFCPFTNCSIFMFISNKMRMYVRSTYHNEIISLINLRWIDFRLVCGNASQDNYGDIYHPAPWRFICDLALLIAFDLEMGWLDDS